MKPQHIIYLKFDLTRWIGNKKVVIVISIVPTRISIMIIIITTPPYKSIIILISCGGMPGKSLLIKLDDHLWTLHIGLSGRDQICLISSLPLHQKHQFSRRVRCSNDFLRLQSTVEPCYYIDIFLQKTKAI